MDPSDLDPEMAAAMGFSSFGMQPSAKKRKYNNRTDAVASSSSATGANQVALAPRAPPTTTSTSTTAPEAANTDEIALDSDDNEADRDAQDDDGGGASLYADPAVAPALAHAQSLIDELATRGGIAAGGGGENGVAPQPVATAPSGLPQRPNASWGTEMGAAPKTLTPRSLYQRNMRERNRNPPPPRLQHPGDKHWYEGYYDPRSNEDPWEVLELSMRGRAGEVASSSKRQAAGVP
ncbi:hypothetical protein CkaCkLH20_08043 [Colletotrichum karsti]|uniref:Uncharacterized protein n=1 Tax=Colletotrichum karsti TaxID=1095194 RepID=A0A9P6I9H0_9PEZI|nr:uncharacterized protein CkaCkLH20_08043 [Colletotrichum karsti]KAF9874480.1 hypothetical protein CkaCkLH20_08043 [Colletotrichum karsti]